MEESDSHPCPSSQTETFSQVTSDEMEWSTREEWLEEDQLRNMLSNNPDRVCYGCFEPSFRSNKMHIAQGVLNAINVNKLTCAGFKVKIWIADWLAHLNEKMGGDMKKIEVFGQYYIEAWKSVGMNLDGGKVEFLWSTREINAQALKYFPPVMDNAKRNNLQRIVRCNNIMGCSEQDELTTAAQSFYPCMHCADIFFLKADICRLGMDQGKVNVLAIDDADDIKRKNKPIALSHHMLLGLRRFHENLSRYEACSAIYMDDVEAEVDLKIRLAYCPPKLVEGNPCLEYIKYLIFPWFSEFKVERHLDNGGSKIFKNFEELVVDYERGDLHVRDLKFALIKAINTILQPVRNHFANDTKAKDLKQHMKAHKFIR